MHVTCERCHLEYQLPDDRIPPGGAQVQCTNCQYVFVARPPLPESFVLDRTEQELLLSLIADLALLRQMPQVQFLGDDDEPTTRSRIPSAPPPGLREIANVRQVPGESPRRWFTSDDLDLIVWLGKAGQPYGFQLCYGKKESQERAVTWWPERGLKHSLVDEGRRDPLNVKGTPTLQSAPPPYEPEKVLGLFEASRGELQPQIADFVAARLR